MPSPIEVSVNGFQSAYVASYGSSPSWLAALLSALMAALPGLLAGCGMAATPAGVQQGITDNPLGTDLKLRQVASSAGVPLGERTKAVALLVSTAKVTSDADMTNLLTFCQAV